MDGRAGRLDCVAAARVGMGCDAPSAKAGIGRQPGCHASEIIPEPEATSRVPRASGSPPISVLGRPGRSGQSGFMRARTPTTFPGAADDSGGPDRTVGSGRDRIERNVRCPKLADTTSAIDADQVGALGDDVVVVDDGDSDGRTNVAVGCRAFCVLDIAVAVSHQLRRGRQVGRISEPRVLRAESGRRPWRTRHCPWGRFEKDGLVLPVEQWRDDARRASSGDAEKAILIVEPEPAVWASDDPSRGRCPSCGSPRHRGIGFSARRRRADQSPDGLVRRPKGTVGPTLRGLFGCSVAGRPQQTRP